MPMSYRERQKIPRGQILIRNHLHELGIQKRRAEIIAGLSERDKYISSKYFYDERGSVLFERITQLPEYYLTRSEKAILRDLDIGFMRGLKDLDIWELGSGNPEKISLIIDHIPAHLLHTLRYYPIDISKSAIELAAEKLLQTYPEITVNGFVADFIQQLDIIHQSRKRLFCFLGSTIGNFTEEQRLDFLGKMNQIMNDDDFFLLGVDTVKNRQKLEKAYNDEQGATAAFNLNILNVVNKICGTALRACDFNHTAVFNEEKKRIEMYLEARTDVPVKSRFIPVEITINKGERIHTENSYKFDNETILEMSKKCGFRITEIFSDNKRWFKLVLLKKR